MHSYRLRLLCALVARYHIHHVHSIAIKRPFCTYLSPMTKKTLLFLRARCTLSFAFHKHDVDSLFPSIFYINILSVE